MRWVREYKSVKISYGKQLQSDTEDYSQSLLNMYEKRERRIILIKYTLELKKKEE